MLSCSTSNHPANSPVYSGLETGQCWFAGRLLWRPDASSWRVSLCDGSWVPSHSPFVCRVGAFLSDLIVIITVVISGLIVSAAHLISFHLSPLTSAVVGHHRWRCNNTLSFHLSLSSAAHRESPNSIPVHYLLLSFHLFFCLPRILYFHCPLQSCLRHVRRSWDVAIVTI